MATDYYAEANSIARLLESDGEYEVASALREAIAAGATATEILMALRYHCEKALDESVGSDATGARLKTFVRALARALEE